MVKRHDFPSSPEERHVQQISAITTLVRHVQEFQASKVSDRLINGPAQQVKTLSTLLGLTSVEGEIASTSFQQEMLGARGQASTLLDGNIGQIASTARILAAEQPGSNPDQFIPPLVVAQSAGQALYARVSKASVDPEALLQDFATLVQKVRDSRNPDVTRTSDYTVDLHLDPRLVRITIATIIGEADITHTEEVVLPGVNKPDAVSFIVRVLGGEILIKRVGQDRQGVSGLNLSYTCIDWVR